jgi:hypothetical protein
MEWPDARIPWALLAGAKDFRCVHGWIGGSTGAIQGVRGHFGGSRHQAKMTPPLRLPHSASLRGAPRLRSRGLVSLRLSASFGPHAMSASDESPVPDAHDRHRRLRRIVHL